MEYECPTCQTPLTWADDVAKCPQCGQDRVWNEGLCLSERWALGEIERLEGDNRRLRKELGRLEQIIAL